MKISASSICEQGGREYNQDYAHCSVKDGGCCLVVCDGLGSYLGSEVASQTCSASVIKSFNDFIAFDPCNIATKQNLLNFIQRAHLSVSDIKETNPVLSGSCTTVASAVTDGKTTVIANIGDSRVYLFKKNKLVFQTTDHSMAQAAVERGEITLDAVRTHKDQNKLTRVLGADYFIAPDVTVLNEPLEAGDAFILCTDGFWEYVFENEMEEALAAEADNIRCIRRMEKKLKERADKNNDNYTVLLARAV